MAAPILSNLSSGTEMFGIGKGEAQVLDLSPMERLTTQKRQQKFAQEQAGLKATKAKQAKRQDDLLKLIAKSRGTKLKPGDVQYFKDAQSKVSQMMMEALDDNEINNEEYMKILGLANQINSEADMSAAQKAQIETGMGAFDDVTMRREAYDEMLNAYNTQGGWGQQFKNVTNIDPSAKYMDFRKKTESMLTKEEGRKIDTAESTEMLTNQIVGDKELMDQVKYDMGKAQGAKKAYGDISDQEAIDTYVNRHVEDFSRIGITPRIPVSERRFAKEVEEERTPITFDPDKNTLTFTDEDDFGKKKRYRYIDDAGKPHMVTASEIQIDFDEQGNRIIKPTTTTVVLTQEEKDRNKDIKAENKDNKKKRDKALEDYNILNPKPVQRTGVFGVGKETDQDFAKKKAVWQEGKDDIMEQYPEQVLPHPEETIVLDEAESSKMFSAFTDLDINTVLEKGAATPGVKWSTLKSRLEGGEAKDTGTKKGATKAGASGITWE